MYAVIETGGKQYRVAPGEGRLTLENAGRRVGAAVEFGRVLAVFDGDNVKTSDLGSALVKGTIAEHGRGVKTIVFKFKRKKQYKRTIGHRQKTATRASM